MIIELTDSLAVYGAAMALINIIVSAYIWKATRPRLVITLRAELVRDFTRLEGDDACERTFSIHGTITPFNRRATLQQLALHISPLREPQSYHVVNKTLDSAEPYNVHWKCNSALALLDRFGTKSPHLVVAIHDAASEKPIKTRVSLRVLDRR